MPLRGAILQIKRKKAPFFIKKNDCKGMKIEIKCTGSDTIQLHELTEFQGELKERSAGSCEMSYTRPEYIDYEGKGFESCLFFAIPENFKKLDKEL